MMLIASLMVMVGINAGFGLLGDFILVRWLNLLAVATWIVVASSASLVVLNDSIKNLRRYGFATSRSRWWFEISRAAWITGLLLGLSSLLIEIPRISEPIFVASLSSILVFVAGTTVGLILTAITGRSPKGRAYECVEYFYLLTLAGVIATFLVIAIPKVLPIGNNTIALSVTLLVCVAVAIFSVKIGKRWQAKIDAIST